MKKVIKRDGSLEDFDIGKLGRVVRAAGLDEKASELVARSVAIWAEKQESATITSLELRDEVQKELGKVNSYAAGLFEWYQQMKDRDSHSG